MPTRAAAGYATHSFSCRADVRRWRVLIVTPPRTVPAGLRFNSGIVFYGWRTCSVVVVVEDTTGRGAVVVCSVVVVRVIGDGPPQAANATMPLRSATPIARSIRDFVLNIA